MARVNQLLRRCSLPAAFAVAAFVGAYAYAQLGAGSPALHTVGYRGYLEVNGTPITGTADLGFQLYDAQSGGAAVGPASSKPGVAFSNGEFSVELDVSPTALAHGDVWVEVTVNGGAPLSPRQRLLSQPYAANGNPPGTVVAFVGSHTPAGWLACDGSALRSNEYPALYAALGTAWGNGSSGAGAGPTTDFNLPDFRGRALIGSGQGLGLSNRVLGDTLGEETHVLTVAEMPSHKHLVPNLTQRVPNRTGTVGGAEKNDGEFNTEFTDVQGSDLPHNNMQPSSVVTYVVKF